MSEGDLGCPDGPSQGGAAWSEGQTPLSTLADALAAFNGARDWGRFHAPKDLATALSIEAAEVLEQFLWRDGDGRGEGGPLDRGAVRRSWVTSSSAWSTWPGAWTSTSWPPPRTSWPSTGQRYPVASARGRAAKYDTLAAEAEAARDTPPEA